MAVISPNTFDPLRRYVNVRLQQGVPLVDADWNELEDVRKFEVRAFLKWFIGDGVPAGNNGFRIAGAGLANDFIIQTGVSGPPDGLNNVGRCLVDGLDVIIDADLNFTAQPLHQDQAGSADLAVALAAPQIVPLAAPAGDETVVVYLDVWERLVTPEEDPSLVHAGLGTESCARVRREWVVRTRTGVDVPAAGDADHLAGHSYYALATLTRRAGDAAVEAGDVIDRREQRLLLPPATLVTDLLGVEPGDYRRGQGRPAISLREAINALLRGELPSTADAALAPAAGVDVIGRAFLFDTTNGLVAVWHSNRVGGAHQIFATRLELDDVAGGFDTPPVQVTSGDVHQDPHAALLPNGDLFVVYQAGLLGPSTDIFYKRAQLGGLNAATEQPVATTAGVAERRPFVVVSSNLAIVFYHLDTTNRWQYRRFQHTDNTWLDATPQELSAEVTPQRDFHAARDATGDIWVAFRSGNNLRALRLTSSTGVVANEVTHDSGAGVDENPFVLPRSNGDVWVFWHSPAGLHARAFASGVWQAVETIPDAVAGDRQATAVEDAEGGIWLFWTRGTVGSGDIFFRRRDPATGVWRDIRQMTIDPNDDSGPFATVAADGAFWIFWSSDRDGDSNLYYKRLVTAI